MASRNGSARSARMPCVARLACPAGDVVRHTSGPDEPARPHRPRRAAVLLLAIGLALAAGCEDPALKFNRSGMQAYSGGNYTEARAAFEEAIERNPDVGV